MNDPHLRVHMREQQELDASIFAPSLTDQEFCGGPPDFIEGEKAVLKEFKRAIKRLSAKFSNAPKGNFQFEQKYSRTQNFIMKDLRDVQMEDYIEDMIGQVLITVHLLLDCVLSQFFFYADCWRSKSIQISARMFLTRKNIRN